jgi:hypothetical protein
MATLTTYIDVPPNERLVMTARGRPFGEARIEIVLTVEGKGTRVALTETPISGPGRWLFNRVDDAILHRRNVESLARLAAMSERRTAPGGSDREHSLRWVPRARTPALWDRA